MSNTDTKTWWQSKTVLGALAVLLALVIRAAAPEADVGEDDVLGALTHLMEAVGAILALYGRVTASKKIGKPPAA